MSQLYKVTVSYQGGYILGDGSKKIEFVNASTYIALESHHDPSDFDRLIHLAFEKIVGSNWEQARPTVEKIERVGSVCIDPLAVSS